MFSSNTSQTSGGYEIQRSLRFNSADTANLSRTPATSTNRRTWTWSGWIKRSELAVNNVFFSAGSNGFVARFNATTDQLEIYNFSSSVYQLQVITAQVFRDASAWYHVVFAVDTTQATDTNRLKIYVNGAQVTAITGTPIYPSQNADLLVNQNLAHALGVLNSIGQYFNGYMTEVNFIDGQALTPSSFGAFDAQTGVWGPTPYAGSYGTNGFYLNFSDNSNTTAATLGKDYSGNGNNWTPNNFSVSAGAGNDSLVDVPTNWGVDTGAGGTVRGNYCTLNPLNATPSPSISNGNLYQVGTTNGHMNGSPSTIGVSSGKWYAEVVFTRVLGSTDSFHVGLADATYPFGALDAGGWYGRFWYPSTGYAYSDAGTKLNSNSATSYGASYTQGDVIGIAFDADAGTLTFYKNGTSQGTAFTGITGTKMFAASCYKDTGITLAFDINLGQRPFAYTAPSGFKALNTQNLPTPTIGATTATQAGKFFNPVLWTANGGVQTITGAGLQPDFLWIKDRQAANSHTLHNIVVGSTKYLESNTTSAEITSANYVTSIDSDGWSIGSSNYLNGRQLVSWCWKANGAGVTNTAGSITSTVSANTTSGFSVVTFTSTGSNATVGHGLGAAPKMIITKVRNQSDLWPVYHVSIGSDKYLRLNTTNAATTDTGVWQNTAPTSSVFSIGASAFPNTWTQVAYCFAEIPGYSRFGSYTGNASTDGPFCFCGFRPAYVMYKKAGGPDGDWVVLDVKRDPTNVAARYLAPNAAQAESNDPPFIDILSNGFKIRRNSGGTNENGVQYIFAAFAESPFKYALAR